MTTPERPTTLCEAFQRTASIDPDAVALRTPGGHPDVDVARATRSRCARSLPAWRGWEFGAATPFR